MAFVDVRLAGGHVSVNTHTIEFLSETPVVKLAMPSGELILFPDEARALAVRLIEAAAVAERGEASEWP
jgi:uncharacterized protein YlzI (FlbEa/FlbD family)